MLSTRLVLKALRTRFVDQRPFILSHLITLRCNADCATCLWKMPANAAVNELSTEDVIGLYREAAATGFQALVLWGGEPLIRPDAADVLRAAREAGLNTTLITNGWFLEARANQVLPHVNRLMVSVDGIGARHDEIRRKEDLFERLDRGLAYTRHHYPDIVVIVNAVLSRLNTDQLEDIARFGKRHGTHVAFQAMDTTDYGFAERSIDLPTIQLSEEEESEIAAQIADMQKRGYPVRASNAYLDRLGPCDREYRCHFKKVCLRVEPNGDILDCTMDAVPLANVSARTLESFITGSDFTYFQARAETCQRCRDAAVVEVSHMWEGRPAAIWNALKSLA
jgi:MoaA/NifB/PqqE/SkfB family radical SAM enzyme